MLVRVGRHAIAVKDVRRIEDHGGTVAIVWPDGERLELSGEDAAAARDLVLSLPVFLGSTSLGSQFADGGCDVRGPVLAPHADAAE